MQSSDAQSPATPSPEEQPLVAERTRNYSVRPSRRSRWERWKSRRLRAKARTVPPEESQFTLTALFVLVTLICISLAGLALGRAYPIGYFFAAAASVAILPMVPPALQRFSTKVLVIIGVTLFLLVIAALALSPVAIR